MKRNLHYHICRTIIGIFKNNCFWNIKQFEEAFHKVLHWSAESIIIRQVSQTEFEIVIDFGDIVENVTITTHKSAVSCKQKEGVNLSMFVIDDVR